LSGHRKRASGAFIFAVVDGGVVVISVLEAQRLAHLQKALAAASTWGEFLARVGDDPATVTYLDGKYGGELPRAADKFVSTDIPGFLEGDWPTWPNQAMLSLLPASVIALGTVKDSLLNGPLLHINEARAGDVVEAMWLEGFECVEDPGDLVVRACGNWQ
jgi:hypothetical protein